MDGHVRTALIVCIAASVVAGGTIAYAITASDWVSRPYDESLVAFSSYDELIDFMERTDEADGYDGPQRVLSPDSTQEMSFDGSSSYSTTNVQVSGVDEADIVKTNGDYIFTASNKEVTVICPHPPDDGHMANAWSVTAMAMQMITSDKSAAIHILCPDINQSTHCRIYSLRVK